jgi:hypothetical protein
VRREELVVDKWKRQRQVMRRDGVQKWIVEVVGLIDLVVGMIGNGGADCLELALVCEAVAGLE